MAVKRLLWRLLALLLVLSVWLAGGVSSCLADGFDASPLTDSGIQIEEVHVGIPGCTGSYHFLWVSDLHIVIDNEEVSEEYHDMVQGRQYGWAVNDQGKPSGEYWVDELAELIDSVHADAILFGGDMLDLCTGATASCLKQGMDQIVTPYMYIRADHDTGTHWTVEADADKNRRLQEDICPLSATYCMEFNDFCILGFNDSTYQLSEEALAEAKAVFDKGKPIIIVTHVPYDSEIDDTLNEASRAAWSDRNLTWGPDTTYVPDATTQQLMDMVYTDDSLVKEVLGGHLHFTWDGFITGKVHQHIFSPAYSKNVGVITVDGNME